MSRPLLVRVCRDGGWQPGLHRVPPAGGLPRTSCAAEGPDPVARLGAVLSPVTGGLTCWGEGGVPPGRRPTPAERLQGAVVCSGAGLPVGGGGSGPRPAGRRC